MKILKPVYLYCMLLLIVSLGAPTICAEDLTTTNKYPNVKIKLFDFTSVRFMGHPIGIGDAQVQFSDYKSTCYAFGENTYMISHLKNEITEKPMEIPEKRAWEERYQLKFRFGQWYFRVKDQIYRIAQGAGSPELIFAPKRNFTQFEISPAGKILLICSGVPQVPVNNWAYFDPFDYYKDGTLKFISVYDASSIEPEKEFEIPDAIAGTIKMVGHIAGPNRSFWVSDTLVIYSSELGRIWCYDSSSSRLNELSTPWASLNHNFIEENIGLTRVPSLLEKTVYIPRDTFPSGFVFFPTDYDTVYLIVRWDKITESGINEYFEKVKSSPFYGGITKLEVRSELLKFFRIDLSKMKIESLGDQEYLLEQLKPLKGHYLLDFDSTPVRWPVYSPPPAVNPK